MASRLSTPIAEAHEPQLSARDLALVLAAHAVLLGLLASGDRLRPATPPAVLLLTQLAAPDQPAPTVEPQHSQPVRSAPAPVRPLPALATPAPFPAASTQPQVRQPTEQRAEQPADDARPSALPASPAEATTPSAPAAAPALTLIEPRYDAAYLANPAPAYPPLSRRLGEEGGVLLRVFVQADGRAGAVELLSSSGSPRLDQAAQDAVRRWTFVPGRQGDAAVAAWVRVPITFSLSR